MEFSRGKMNFNFLFLNNHVIMQKSIKFWFSKRNDTASFILIAYRKISMLWFQSKTAERFERKMLYWKASCSYFHSRRYLYEPDNTNTACKQTVQIEDFCHALQWQERSARSVQCGQRKTLWRSGIAGNLSAFLKQNRLKEIGPQQFKEDTVRAAAASSLMNISIS